MKKRVLSALLAVALCAGLSISAFAANEMVSATMNRTVKVAYNGVAQGFSNEKGESVYPVVYNSTTYLPIRAVSNLLGLNVKYENGTVVLTTGGTVKQNTNPVYGVDEAITAELNRDIKVTFDGVAKTLTNEKGETVYPVVYDGTIYVPVRAVSNLLSLPIDYKDGTVILGTAPVVPPTASAVSDNWLDLQFTLDGVKFAVPFSFKSLQDQGWNVDFTGYKDMDETYIINPNGKVSGTIALTNPKYSDKFTFWVGFKNNATTAQTILNCDVWSVKFDTTSGFKKVSSYPAVVVAKGITWGATKDAVLAAFGEPKESYTSEEYKYSTLTYQYEYDKHLKFTIYDEFGVTAISMDTYK